MHQRIFIFILLFCTAFTQAQRQSIIKNDAVLKGYEEIPQEKIFIHYNTSLLFSGEYLYYHFYCLDKQSNLLSDLSKIGYIELIDQKGHAVFRHKISLENGLGHGDYFVPVDVPSGNYKLIGYTQWMLNEQNLFFQGDISILNPYQKDQKSILSENSDQDSSTLSPESNLLNIKKSKKNPKNGDKSAFTLKLNKQVFKKRSPVTLNIFDETKNDITGNYSISVRKKSSFSSAPLKTASEFYLSADKKKDRQKKQVGSSFFLPEMRGELLYGKITSKDPKFPISYINIALSFPKENDDVKIVPTNKNGEFIFNIQEKHITNKALIQVLGDHRKNYDIQLYQFPEVKHQEISFYPFKITTALQDDIIKRSIYNQVENNFYNIKPDSIKTHKEYISFYGNQKETYNLDDYTRFSTVKETITEIVNGVGYQKIKNGEFVFVINGKYPDLKSKDLNPLLLVDGTVLQEHDKILNYDARKVKSISFIRDRYFLGEAIFEGILSIQTISGNYLEEINEDYLLKAELIQPEANKKYFSQKYVSNNKSQNHIPDYRQQLFWEPSFALTGNKKEFSFFTSDIAGKYEICVEGFTNKGKPISLKKSFNVE